MTPALRTKLSKSSRTVDRGQITALVGVNSFFGFCRPLRFDFTDTRPVETLPKQINQHRSFLGIELRNLFLNGCKAHGEMIDWMDSSVKMKR
jgi:hypothetical protein